MTTESNNEGVVTPPPKNSYAVQMAQQLLELRQRANDGLINIDHYVNQASPLTQCSLGGITVDVIRCNLRSLVVPYRGSI